ncbi:hypothetical protein HY339_03165 [Candidatus Gottesmanbacteria bacterium]|nr:hypothetical protein [Candidatus Gottesmanbacteria bacterium]
MLTIKDLLKLQKIISDTLDEKLKQFYDDHIKYLPTKDEFFTRMDKLSGEYKKIDEAETLHTGMMSEHTDTLENHDQRITALENRKVSSPAPIAFPNL